MIDKLWFSNHWLSHLLWPLLWPLSLVFKWVSTKRKAAFVNGSRESYRAPIAIVVVGNVTAGGNGKTPIVIWLVEQLQALGHKPGVVSRGYGGKSNDYPLIVDDDREASQCGDEPKLIQQRTGALVAVSPVRSDAVKALLSQGVDVIIADDGLQHYALQRDVEIIVVDGVRRFGNEKLIPLGPLREPVSRCDDVDFVINNGGKVQGCEMPMTLQPNLAKNLVTGETKSVSQLGSLVAFAGIGHPPRFFRTLIDLGAELSLTKGFSDHKTFDPQELEQLSQAGDNLIMTEKDAVKCRSYAQDNWWYLPVSAQFDRNDQKIIIQRIQEVIEQYGSSSA
ncbi:tetraacyldisaccharide 4'-kinase [Vibrio sp. WJH972]